MSRSRQAGIASVRLTSTEDIQFEGDHISLKSGTSQYVEHKKTLHAQISLPHDPKLKSNSKSNSKLCRLTTNATRSRCLSRIPFRIEPKAVEASCKRRCADNRIVTLCFVWSEDWGRGLQTHHISQPLSRILAYISQISRVRLRTARAKFPG